MDRLSENRINKFQHQKIKQIMLNIHDNITYIYNIWLTRNTSKTFMYIMNLKNMFDIHGISMFEDAPESIDIVKGSYLYSQKIDKKKIRLPKNLDNSKKEKYKEAIQTLITNWNYLGEKFSYENLSKVIYKCENDKLECEKHLSNIKI